MFVFIRHQDEVLKCESFGLWLYNQDFPMDSFLLISPFLREKSQFNPFYFMVKKGLAIFAISGFKGFL